MPSADIAPLTGTRRDVGGRMMFWEHRAAFNHVLRAFIVGLSLEARDDAEVSAAY